MDKFKKQKANSGYTVATPIPTEEELSAFYQHKYYQSNLGGYKQDYSQDELNWYANMARIVEHVAIKQVKKNNFKILDIGCGEGFFSSYFLKNGHQVKALDYSNYGFKQHNLHIEECFVQGDIFENIDKIIATQEKFDVINMGNVLEHLRDPEKILNGIQGIMTEGALIRVKVPNDYSDFQKLLIERNKTTDTWFSPPEHINYFNITSLKNIAKELGFNVHKVITHYPIEQFLLNDHSNYWIDRSKGRQAHLCRVITENHLIDTNIEAYIEYAEASAKLNYGREISIFLEVKNED